MITIDLFIGIGILSTIYQFCQMEIFNNYMSIMFYLIGYYLFLEKYL